MNRNRGFVRLVIGIVIAILILSYFGFNIRAIVESPTSQDNLGYAWSGVLIGYNWVNTVWNTYLREPALYLWQNIFISLLWESMVDNLQRIKDGNPTILQELAPQVGTSTVR